MLGAAGAGAWALNTQQLAVLSTNMQVRTEQSVIDAVAAQDAPFLLDFYNGDAGLDYVIWDDTIEPDTYKGAIRWSEFDAISAAKRSSFEILTGSGTATLNAAHPNVRAGIADIFSAASQAQTRANMDVILRRPATEWERLQVGETGQDPGTTENPGTAIWPGQLVLQDILDALALL